MDATAAGSDAAASSIRAALLEALRLQAEWGADEALAETPLDRLALSLRAGSPAPDRGEHRLPPAASQAGRSAAVPRPPQAPVGSHAPHPALAAGASLDALLAAWAGFEGCALRRTAASTVLPWGDPAAPLVLVADAPDGDDDRAGRPFAGSAGQYLDRMLASIGLSRTALRVAFLIPWRPPGGRPPSDAEMRACLPFLQRYLVLAPPKRLILLGNLSVRALAGAESLRRARGRWREVALPGLAQPVPALATYPPAQVKASPPLRRDAWADLLRLRQAVDENRQPADEAGQSG